MSLSTFVTKIFASLRKWNQRVFFLFLFSREVSIRLVLSFLETFGTICWLVNWTWNYISLVVMDFFSSFWKSQSASSKLPHDLVKLKDITAGNTLSNTFFSPSPKGIFSFFLGREEGRERNIHVREKHWWVALLTHLDQGTNPQPSGYGTMLQPTEPHQPQLKYTLYTTITNKFYISNSSLPNTKYKIWFCAQFCSCRHQRICK